MSWSARLLPSPDKPSWLNFALNRKVGFAALMICGAVLVAITSRAEVDAQFLREVYDLNAGHLQALFATLTLGCLLLFVFEPTIRAELADGKATGLILAGAAATSFAAIQLTYPSQALRLFRYAPTVGWATGGLLALSVLAAILVALHPQAAPGKRLTRYATIVVALLALALIGAHVVSVGHFMRLDLPDEPILASIATNYAQYGELTTGFDGEIYGNPDPSAARLYFLMGVWSKIVGRTDFHTLRSFSLLMGAFSLLLTAGAAFITPQMPRLQRMAAIAVLLALSPFVRASHNLRPDIGLAVYGSLILLSVSLYWRNDNRHGGWLLLSGVALFVGLESLPTYSLSFGAGLGMLVVIQALRRPLQTSRWSDILYYGAGCIIAGVLYFFSHFLPDVQTQLANFQAFSASYGAENAGRVFQSPVFLLQYFTYFSYVISPAEFALAAIGIVGLARSSNKQDKWVGALLLVGIVTMLYPWAGSYGYLALTSPFIAYAVARSLRTERTVMIGVFVLLIATASAPLYDMLNETHAAENEHILAEAALLTWQIPENTTLVGEDKFFFTLHTNRRFIGQHGLNAASRICNITQSEALDYLNVDIVICKEGSPLCTEAEQAGFADPSDFTITDGNYLVYRRP